jgi:hypothetical protein
MWRIGSEINDALLLLGVWWGVDAQSGAVEL